MNQIEDFSHSYSALTDEPESLETILIVDDEEIVRRFHFDCLSGRYRCFEASSAEEALEILEEEDISLVITDWVMPGMSGTTLLRQVVADFPNTPVVMVTGVDHPERALDAMRFGAFDYLLKPSQPDSLDITVERALRHRELQIRNEQYKVDLELQNIELARQKAELERLQDRIIQTEKMASVGQLTAGIAHELNNPLGYISGNLQILEQYFQDIRRLLNVYENAELSGDYAGRIEKLKEEVRYDEIIENLGPVVADCINGTGRVTELIENLRVFSKLDQPEFTKTDINRDINATVKLLGRYFEKENVSLKLNYGDVPKIDAYPAHLNQVWMNLLLNAAQAVEENGGEVSVTTRVLDGDVIVKISDTGGGIAPENLHRIFEPFFTTKNIGQGTGLGLSTAYGIVEEHCGTISVTSGSGKETTFTINLPIECLHKAKLVN